MAQYKKLDVGFVLRYYKRQEIQEALVEAGSSKEVAVSYGGTGYGKRPDSLAYPRDVLEAVKQGATSFHCSEELWKNPLQVVTGMKPQELNELRSGWDLLLDIDCPELEYSKIAGDLLVQALRYHGIKSVSVKFSGNHGFHIGIPFEAFPEIMNGVPVKNLFPEGPRKIAAYLASMIKDALAQKILEKEAGDVSLIAKNIGKEQVELVKNGKLDGFAVLTIDTVLIASRHLYRMPYSLNEKSGLASIVIPADSILSFDRPMADPDKVIPKLKFMERMGIVPNEAKKLIVHAFDFKSANENRIEVPKQENNRAFDEILTAIPAQFFPPCIQKISEGMIDGKKRALLILINFLGSCGWKYEEIERYVNDWNKKNPEPLREVYINGQLRYAKTQKPKLPPSCKNKAYMVDIGVCVPDGFCRPNGPSSSPQFDSRVKNPASYALMKQRNVARDQEIEQNKGKRKKKEPPIDVVKIAKTPTVQEPKQNSTSENQ
ncbi:hypothetical protein J4219_03275 [Candidatus Woesearchaeota archaeon]|nr:hypothetical protein [Candidatus Woesearchaeota archaeon]